MPSAGSYTGLFQHPAAVLARRSDAETGAEILEQRRRQPLGEDIGELLCTRDLEDAELPDGHFHYTTALFYRQTLVGINTKVPSHGWSA